jgi:NDP-sugar pyrophosphorylase family protein
MDIVFLCGGEGTRLRPLTYAVPKPMLPIGSKPILEINITKAKELGFKRCFLMVNYKAEVISAYFGDGSTFGVDIQYFEEHERRGTAGPLFFLKDTVSEPFVVMNADIMTDLDLKLLLASHKKKGADLTVALKRVLFDIPYGVAELSEDNEIESLDEKPTYQYMINSGIYVVSTSLIDVIPENGVYHMTDLIVDARKKGKSVVGHVFEDSWRDIGRLDDYIKAVNENGGDAPLGPFGSDF